MADNFVVDTTENYTTITSKVEKLDGVVSPELKAVLVQASGEGAKYMILDLSESRYCDSSGLSAVLIGNRLCKAADGAFVLTGLTEMVEKLITISQLNNVLNITPTVQEAIDMIQMEKEERAAEGN
jgi:anti-sigma B factor antagonist